MEIKQAFDVILDLASENMLDEKDPEILCCNIGAMEKVKRFLDALYCSESHLEVEWFQETKNGTT
jgi:hypothetical protein